MKKILSIVVLLITSFAFSQGKVVKGTVTDEYNEPFLGVNVIIDGTSQGTIADIDGNYSIKVEDENTVLVFSYLGYITSKQPVAGTTLINVAMKPDVESLDAVVITTGIRASQLAAVKAKRNASTVIEAITPEDIGSFSDTNVADALQRVAGVQIERDVDEVSGDRVSIRGIGPQFVSVTMNGRTPISAGSEGKSDFRKFNLNVIPTEIVSGAKIHKTTEAKEVATSIGGTVDFETMKPLDAKYKGGKNYFGSVSAKSSSNSEFAEFDFGSRFTGVFGGKITEKLGMALAVIYADEKKRKDEASLRSFDEIALEEDTDEDSIDGILAIKQDTDGDGIADVYYDNVIAAKTYNNTMIRTEEERFATSAAIQWSPIEELDFVFDYTRTAVESNSNRQTLGISLGPGGDNGLLGGRHVFGPDDLILNDAQDRILYVSPNSNDQSSVSINGKNQFYDNHTTNNILGLRTIYEPTEKFNILADVSYSDLDFFQNLTQIQGNLVTGDFDHTDLGIDVSGERPAYELPNEIFDPESITLNSVSRRHIRTQGYNYAAKMDFEYKLDDDAKISAGARYTKTQFEARQTVSKRVRDLEQFNNGNGISDEDIETFKGLLGQITGVGFNGGITGLSNGWLDTPGQAVLDMYPGFDDLNGAKVFDFDVDLKDVESDDDDLEFSPGNSYGASESSTDFYTQLDLTTELFELPVDLNFGLRAIRTVNLSKGFSSLRLLNVNEDEELGGGDTYVTDEALYHEVERSRTDWLPSFNANFTLYERTKLRLNASRGVSRPRFRDLIPNNTVTFVTDIPPGTDLATSQTIRGSVTSGNPDLKPYTAWMFDTTLEFYSKNGGAFILSSFYKQLNNYIARQILVDQEYPGEELLGIPVQDGQEDLLFTVTRPINISNGQIYGFEAGFNQSFSYFPGFFEDFGIQANYSFIDSRFDENVGDESSEGFPGSSNHNANGVIYYEKNGFSFRFTAAYRGDYLSNLGGLGNTRADEAHYTEGTTTLGFTAKKAFLNKKLQVSAGVSNFTGVDVRRYQGGDKENLSAYYDRDPVWKLSLRYKL